MMLKIFFFSAEAEIWFVSFWMVSEMRLNDSKDIENLKRLDR